MVKKFLYFLFIFSTEMVYAVGFQPLAPSNPITGDISNPTNFMGLLNSIFRWGIAVAVTLAIIMITVGGLQYMTTDAISGKKDGKEKIKAAFAGLLLALSGWLILNTINPQIVKTRIDLRGIRAELPNNTPPPRPAQSTYGDDLFSVDSNIAADNETRKLLTKVNIDKLNKIAASLKERGLDIEVVGADTQGGDAAYITIKNKESLSPDDIKTILSSARSNGFEATTYTMPVGKIPNIYREQLVNEGISNTRIMGGSIDRPYEHFMFSTTQKR